MSITRSRAALCVVDPGTRPARYGRWSDGIFRKYSVRINSEQEAKHGKKKERAPSTPSPRERRILPRELRRPPASGSGYGAPTRPPRPLSGSSGIHVNYNFKPRQTPTPDPREHKSNPVAGVPTIGYTFHATHFNHKNIYRHREFVTIYLCLPARKRSQDELIVPSVNVLVPPRLVCVTSGGAFLHGERNIGVLPDRNTQLARD